MDIRDTIASISNTLMNIVQSECSEVPTRLLLNADLVTGRATVRIHSVRTVYVPSFTEQARIENLNESSGVKALKERY